MVKTITSKLNQNFTGKFYKSEDSNPTHQEKHPLELIDVEIQNKIKRLDTWQGQNQKSTVLSQTKGIQKMQEEKHESFDYQITDQQKRRIKKQAKYSSLETLTMRMLKERGIYAQSKYLAKINNVAEQKNYCIIALRLSLLYHQETKNLGKSKQQIISWMFQYLRRNLETCINKKYLNSNSETFINLVKAKNMCDLAVFKKAMESNFQKFKQVHHQIQGLYEKKNNGSPSLKNKIFCQKVTEILIGVALSGSAFLFATQPSFEKQISQNKTIKTQSKRTELSKLFEGSEKVPSFQQLPPLENYDMGQKYQSDELFDLTSQQEMDKFLKRQYEINTDLEYYSNMRYEDSFMDL